MAIFRFVPVIFALGLVVAMQACIGTSPERLIDQHDHPSLASYYAQQAQELRDKAKQWEFMAEFYEKHPEPEAKPDSAQHAAHCRTIAQNYQKAAEEADALATEHRRQRPHGMIN